MNAIPWVLVLSVIFSAGCSDNGGGGGRADGGGGDGQAQLPDGPEADGAVPDYAPADAAIPDAAPLKPSSEWVVTAIGSGMSQGLRLVMDSAGNSYITGNFQGVQNFGSLQVKSKGAYDLFVAKLGPNGKFLWVTGAGGISQTVVGSDIARDSAGNLHVTGGFSGTVSFGSHQLTAKGKSDIFVAKLDPNGNFIWATRAGGAASEDESGQGVAVDGKGNVLVTGRFQGVAGFGSVAITSAGKSDLFVVRLDSGGKVLWAAKGGGANEDCGWDIEVDAKGDSHISGSFNGPKAIFGSTTLTSGLSQQGRLFVAKLDSGGKFLWTSGSWGTSNSTGAALALDSAGNSYVAGSFGHLATFGTLSLNSAGNWDTLVVKLDASGNYVWASQAGGTGDDIGTDLHTDSAGNIYLTGLFEGNASFGSTTLTGRGMWDIYTSKLNAKGNFLWALGAGGSGQEMGSGVAAVPQGGAMVTGLIMASAVFGSTTVACKGMSDLFVWKVAETQ